MANHRRVTLFEEGGDAGLRGYGPTVPRWSPRPQSCDNFAPLSEEVNPSVRSRR